MVFTGAGTGVISWPPAERLAVSVMVPATVPVRMAGFAEVGKIACVVLARTMYCRLRVPFEKVTILSVPPTEDANPSVRTPVISNGYGELVVTLIAGCVVPPRPMEVGGG